MSYIGRDIRTGAFRQLDDISSGFDGSDTTHTMQVNSTNVSVGDVNQILLSLGGVIQKPGTDFTVSGSTLTFTTAPAANTSFFAILLGSDNGGTVTPTDGSVTSAKLSGNLVTPGTLDVNGQELILDADADTSITADTDDQIDFKVGGNDTHVFDANGHVTLKQFLDATTAGGRITGASNRGNVARVNLYQTAGSSDGGEIRLETADSSNSMTERMRIGAGGHVGIGVSTTSNKVRILQDQSDENCVQIEYDTSSADESVMRWFCDRASNVAWDFLQAYSNNASSADLEFQMTSAGSMSADGSFSGSGADYAEYFETADGNAITIGKTVVLDGNKVRASTSSDDASAIIGVVRPKEDGKCSMTIGNTAWNHWTDKYLTDDFGVFIWEDYTVKEWTEKTTKENGNIEVKNHSYPFDAIPEGVTVPDDAKEITQQRKKQNPDWNEDTEYVKRQDRKEWVIIGLLGQIPINKNEKTGTNWVKMRDISDTVEEWFVR